MSQFGIYLTMSKQLGLAYIGKGTYVRPDQKRSEAFARLMKAPDMEQYESARFSSEKDAFIAEAATIAILACVGSNLRLLNIQKSYRQRFFPRYPVRYVDGSVKKKDLQQAIIVTLTPGKLENDRRKAPNSPWKPKELAERARKYWQFKRSRVERWSREDGAPNVLVAVAKGNARILGVFEINNDGWLSLLNKRDTIRSIPLKDKDNANFLRGMPGKVYTGRRQGGSVIYGDKVA
jgi:hypothetical protein